MATTKTGNVWAEILSRVEAKVNRHSFYTWFKPTAFVQEAGLDLTVKVPNGLFRDWLTKHYAGVIREALGELDREGIRIAFVTDAEAAKPAAQLTLPTPSSDQKAPAAPPPRGLNPRYTFDNFVVGSSNQFCAGRSASRGGGSFAIVQPAVSLRWGRAWQDSPNACNRPVSLRASRPRSS